MQGQLPGLEMLMGRSDGSAAESLGVGVDLGRGSRVGVGCLCRYRSLDGSREGGGGGVRGEPGLGFDR